MLLLKRSKGTVGFLLRYVSSQYIQDCIDKGEQLNLEDYRLKPEALPRQSARLSIKKQNSPVYLEGMVERPDFTLCKEHNQRFSYLAILILYQYKKKKVAVK